MPGAQTETPTGKARGLFARAAGTMSLAPSPRGDRLPLRRIADRRISRAQEALPFTLTQVSLARLRAQRLRSRTAVLSAMPDRVQEITRVATVPIVWRRGHDRAAYGDAAASMSKSAEQHLGVPGSVHAAPRDGVVIPSRVSAFAPRVGASLDPAAVERLTDDIVHRIERRVRIERERRGL